MNKQVSIRELIFWTAIICCAFFLFRTCKGTLGGIFGGGKTDTISVKSDTVWMIAQGDTTYIPQPYSVTNTNTVYRTVYKTDTLEILEVLPTDTAAIVERFYQKVFYSDTQNIKYGKVIIDDTVYKNRIASRRVVTDIKIPEVTNTVTLKKKKNIVYVGISAMGSMESPLYAVGGDLSLKTKTDRMYSVGAYTTKDGKIYYAAGYKAPIRFRKQK